jgi:hypothetical protein
MQVSLRYLILVLSYCALFCVAIINPSSAWVVVLRGIAMVSLLFAMMAIWYRREERRAYWVGYLHGAGAYALLTFYALGGITDRPVWNHRQIISGEVAGVVYRWLPRTSTSAANELRLRISSNRALTGVGMMMALPSSPPASFCYLFHSAFVMLCGALGGLVGVWAYKTQGESGPRRVIPGGTPATSPDSASETS